MSALPTTLPDLVPGDYVDAAWADRVLLELEEEAKGLTAELAQIEARTVELSSEVSHEGDRDAVLEFTRAMNDDALRRQRLEVRSRLEEVSDEAARRIDAATEEAATLLSDARFDLGSVLLDRAWHVPDAPDPVPDGSPSAGEPVPADPDVVDAPVAAAPAVDVALPPDEAPVVDDASTTSRDVSADGFADRDQASSGVIAPPRPDSLEILRSAPDGETDDQTYERFWQHGEPRGVWSRHGTEVARIILGVLVPMLTVVVLLVLLVVVV